MEQVQRYDDSDNLYDHIVARDDGDYVLYSDYAQLQSELYAANRMIDDQRVKLDTSYITEHGRIAELEAELDAARGERDKWRELEHAAIETAGFNAAQLAAANEKLAVMAVANEVIKASLRWAIRVIEDDRERTGDTNGTPVHECELFTNPERGGCRWHEEYWTAKDLIGELAAGQGEGV